MSTTVSAADPSITYSPQSAWTSGVGGTMLTTTADATAELSFTGDSVQVFGAIPSIKPESTRPVSTYSLDNSTSLSVFNSTNFPSKANVPAFLFYQSSGLVDEDHSLLITSTENQTLFVLHFIVYGLNLPSSNSSLSLTTGASASSTSFSTLTNSDVSSSKSLIGGIVGGIIAALAFFMMAALIIFCRRRQRKTSALEVQNSDTDCPPMPKPFLLSSRWKTRDRETISPSGDSYEGSIVSLDFPSDRLDANSEPSSNSVVWGSISHSVSTTSTVIGDRLDTSFTDEKDGRVLENSLPTPVTPALNYRSTAVSMGSRTTWNTRESAPPPSWAGLSDAPPSYTTTK